MDEYILEIEDCLTKLEALKSEKDTVTNELQRAEQAGESHTCLLCGTRWLEILFATFTLNEQVERTIMFRLPPSPTIHRSVHPAR